jgi:NADH-quinone oxidoreductase subunit H
VGIVVLTGSLSFTEIVEWQRVYGWGFVWQFWAFPIFFIAATAEINRTPFDMVEADSEIVAGFATEYSGMRFGFFFFAEYVALFIMSAIVVTLFFGGWLPPFLTLPDGIGGTILGAIIFLAKTYFFVFVAVWMRTTLPRVRVDRLMGMAWKWLLPLALVNLFLTAGIVLIFNLQPVGGA